jgi:tetratricopeptide (TPR) repeat protein
LRRILLLASLALMLFLSSPARADSFSPADNSFREGWSFLSEEKYAEARESFGVISPDEYDLGDYVLYLTGIAWAREGKSEEAAATHDRLTASFPRSPLLPYLAHELAFAAAIEEDIPTAEKYYRASRGKVDGNGRKAAEMFIAARLMEERGKEHEKEREEEQDEEREEEQRGEGKGKIEWKKAAEAHLENFSSYMVQEGSLLSMNRLWEWRQEGRLSTLGLPVSFYGKYAKALFRAGEEERALALYRETLKKFSPSDPYYEVLLDYAEFLRKQGDTSGARSLLRKPAGSSSRSRGARRGRKPRNAPGTMRRGYLRRRRIGRRRRGSSESSGGPGTRRSAGSRYFAMHSGSTGRNGMRKRLRRSKRG